jgi:Zn finger protein HypA/HybF involved in hydrogenase expression
MCRHSEPSKESDGSIHGVLSRSRKEKINHEERRSRTSSAVDTQRGNQSACSCAHPCISELFNVLEFMGTDLGRRWMFSCRKVKGLRNDFHQFVQLRPDDKRFMEEVRTRLVASPSARALVHEKEIECPKCHQTATAEQYQGRCLQVTCPNCGQSFKPHIESLIREWYMR